tara:strand:+ start:407 stop:598 length:192 start_codon:yes stop_codon:yes gene_type:complete
MRNMILVVVLSVMFAAAAAVVAIEQVLQIGLIDFLVKFIPLDTPCLQHINSPQYWMQFLFQKQ